MLSFSLDWIVTHFATTRGYQCERAILCNEVWLHDEGWCHQGGECAANGVCVNCDPGKWPWPHTVH